MPQIPQNSKFVIPLQYQKKKKGRYEVEFLHADKHHISLQIDTINLGGHSQASITPNIKFVKSL